MGCREGFIAVDWETPTRRAWRVDAGCRVAADNAGTAARELDGEQRFLAGIRQLAELVS